MISMKKTLVLLGCAAFAAGIAGTGGCGSTSDDTTFQNGPDGGGLVDATDDINFFPGDDGGTTATLDVEPKNPVLNYPTDKTKQFQALESGKAVGASWVVDNPFIGSMDQNGLFTATGTVGGTGIVTATSGKATGSTTVSVIVHVAENPGNVSASDQSKLKAGGNADSGFKWLYPYDKTVFPRGLAAPVLQFAGTAPTSFYVHITSKFLDYEGFYSGTNPARITMSPATWTTISKSAQANDPVTVEVTKLAGGAVTGPIKEGWTVAQGSLKGTVYYNSYSSQLAGGGATLKIKIGQPVAVLLGGCHVCHSVSANGNVLAVSGSDYHNGQTYDLTNNTTQMATNPNGQFSFGGLTPDGAKLLSCGAMPGTWPPNVPGIYGTHTSQLINTKTGAVMSAPGFDGKVTYAVTPAFSPDGKKVAFDHYDTGSGHTMAVMDFDDNTNTFSNLTDVATDNGHYLAWPAFLPDDKTLLFHQDSHTDFATWSGAQANLEGVDIASKTTVMLDALNGIANGQPYLPYGTNDVNLNYEPTVLPEAVGGYYWVVFTSRRYYGNTITDSSAYATARKKLWVAAIDINGTPGKDPSHPAFYLPDQELSAGNMRGFWALDPCHQNGNDCTSGDECCTGFCRPDGDGGLSCVPPPNGCSHEFEKCTTASDCCDTGSLCINGKCATPPPN